MSAEVRALNLKATQDVFHFVIKAKGAVQKMTREVLKEIANRLMARSPYGQPALWKRKRPPKGYKPGHFKLNWQLGVDNIPRNVLPGEDASGQMALAAMYKAIPQWPVGHVFTFVNNAPYATVLEYGMHSKQVPPGGMVGLTKREFPQIVREAEMNLVKGK